MPQPANTVVGVDELLRFWFGDGDTALAVAADKTSLWWGKDDAVDREITERFAATVDAAADGELDHLADTPRGLLALIICTDQLPRNIHRGTPRAFATDSLALAHAKRCVDDGVAKKLTPIERVFVYLPFEHSENLTDQQRSVALYRELADTAAADETELFTNYLGFAQRHHDIIQQFGRFPHRNQILNRISTAEEKHFLTQPNSSF